MLPVVGDESFCVCGRFFRWERVLLPDARKGDRPRWLVAFASGIADSRWDSWCRMLQEAPPLIDYDAWGVLLVTNESPDEQLAIPLYRSFDCATVRTLSDPSCTIGTKFGVPVTGEPPRYQFSVVMVQEGAVVRRFL